jgi:hypothetical protein
MVQLLMTCRRAPAIATILLVCSTAGCAGHKAPAPSNCDSHGLVAHLGGREQPLLNCAGQALPSPTHLTLDVGDKLDVTARDRRQVLLTTNGDIVLTLTGSHLTAKKSGTALVFADVDGSPVPCMSGSGPCAVLEIDVP